MNSSLRSSRVRSAFTCIVASIATPEGSVRIAAERFVNIETNTIVVHLFPLLTTIGIIDGYLDIVPSVGLEVVVVPEPAFDLSTEVVPDSLRGFGVYKVLLAGVKRVGRELR